MFLVIDNMKLKRFSMEIPLVEDITKEESKKDYIKVTYKDEDGEHTEVYDVDTWEDVKKACEGRSSTEPFEVISEEYVDESETREFAFGDKTRKLWEKTVGKLKGKGYNKWYCSILSIKVEMSGNMKQLELFYHDLDEEFNTRAGAKAAGNESKASQLEACKLDVTEPIPVKVVVAEEGALRRVKDEEMEKYIESPKWITYGTKTLEENIK